MNNSKIQKIINQYGGDEFIKLNFLENMIESSDKSSDYLTDVLNKYQTSSEIDGGRNEIPKISNLALLGATSYIKEKIYIQN
jgi:hypothetical protein